MNRLPIKRVPFGSNPTQQKALPLPARINSSIRNLLANPTWSVRSLLPPDSSSAKSSQINVQEEITREKLHHLLRLSALPPPKSDAEETKLLNALRRHLHFVREVRCIDTSKPSTYYTPRASPLDVVQRAIYPDPNTQHAQEEVEPLITIRDETLDGINEATIDVGDLLPALDKEKRRGMNRAVRRTWKVNTDWEKDSENHLSPNMENATQQQMTQEEAESQQLKREEALAEKRDWWIDVNKLGGGLETRKKGKYFFVKKQKKG